MDERQLEWVRRNLTHERRPTRAIGDLTQEYLADPSFRGPAWRRRLFSVLAEDGAGDLMDHAEIVDVRQGVLRIEVTEPGLLYHLRLQWEQRLLHLLQARLPEAGINAIRFSVGLR